MPEPTDTICALSSAPGRSGLAVVRVSGNNSKNIFNKIFQPHSSESICEPRSAVLGHVIDPVSEKRIDEAVAVNYYAPKSYTGEDMTEYSIHGSPVLVSALLDCICQCGARLAEPGEFTLRAFLHGKMDLLQAEAIADIIHSTTFYQAQVAARQRSGSVSREIRPIQNIMTEIIVQLETAVEFVDENISTESIKTINVKLSVARNRIRRWIDSFHQGRIIREGFNLAVIGRTNVGKSSLFNALLKQDRSIVLDMPGTTRDLISEFTSICGIPVRLLDTAGIQESVDSAESIGVERSFRAITDADAVLFVLDRSSKKTVKDKEIKKALKDLPCIFVFNKNDLKTAWNNADVRDFSGSSPWIEVSALTGDGVEKLRTMIFDSIFGGESPDMDDVLITNLRHRHCLEDVEKELINAENALNDGLSEEFALMHLHKGLASIGAITGKTSVEDILDIIFSRFCIGK